MRTETWTRYPIGAARVAADDARDRATADTRTLARIVDELANDPTVYELVVTDYGFDPLADNVVPFRRLTP